MAKKRDYYYVLGRSGGSPGPLILPTNTSTPDFWEVLENIERGYWLREEEFLGIGTHFEVGRLSHTYYLQTIPNTCS